MVYKTGDQLLARQGFGRLLSLYDVRYLITLLPFEEDGFELLGVYGSDAYLYENQNVCPGPSWCLLQLASDALLRSMGWSRPISILRGGYAAPGRRPGCDRTGADNTLDPAASSPAEVPNTIPFGSSLKPRPTNRGSWC